MPGLYNADAGKVAEEICSIGEHATTAQIVEKARDAGTELHKCFEWDDTKAAEKWRLQTARNVVCSLVFREKEQTEAPAMRLFFKTDAASGYAETTTIIQNADEYQKLLQRALGELRAFQRKYQSLVELDGLMETIEALTA